MRSLAYVALAVAVLVASPTQATETTSPADAGSPGALPPKLQDAVSMRAIAEAEIAKAGAADLFENVSDSEHAMIRHLASGMVCRAADDGVMPIMIYEGSPRGDDVSCGSRFQGITTTTYATRYGDGMSAQEALEASVAAIYERFQDVTAYRGDAVSTSGDGLPATLTARFEARIDGKRVFTRTSAVAVGEWIIAQRVTGPVENASLADLVGEMNLITTLISMGALEDKAEP